MDLELATLGKMGDQPSTSSVSPCSTSDYCKGVGLRCGAIKDLGCTYKLQSHM